MSFEATLDEIVLECERVGRQQAYTIRGYAQPDVERARLVAALEDAERDARTLPDERHALLVTYQASSTGLSVAEWDRIAEDFDATADEVRRKVGDAWDALQAFDEATSDASEDGERRVTHFRKD